MYFLTSICNLRHPYQLLTDGVLLSWSGCEAVWILYVVLPIFPDPDPNHHNPGKPVWVIPRTNSWDCIPESKPPATIWFDKGDEINFRTTTENMERVPGTIIRVKKI